MAKDLTFKSVYKHLASERLDLAKDLDPLFDIALALGRFAAAGPITAITVALALA